MFRKTRKSQGKAVHIKTSSVGKLAAPAAVFHPMLFQNPGYPGGDTPLHRLIGTYTNVNPITTVNIDELIAQVGLESVVFMSVVTNDAGETPLDMVCRINMLDDDVFENLYQKLAELMKAYPVKPMHQLIDTKQILQPVRSVTNIRLKNNLKIAVYLTNKVRRLIDASATHPSLNEIPPSTAGQVEDAVGRMRTFIDVNPISGDLIENMTHYAIKYKCGNCHEFSCAVVHYLRKLDPGLGAEMVRIANGDHVFVVIDRKPDSEIKNVAQWGESAVVCDAWSGDVYPADQLPFKLMCFDRIRYKDNGSLNILNTFNPRFHRLNIDEIVLATAAKPHCSSLFKQVIARKKRVAHEVTDLKSRAAKRTPSQ